MHMAGEEAVAASGLDWTFLRPRAFMSNTLRWGPAIRAGDAVQLPFPDAPHASVDPRDIAGVAVRALTTPGHEGRIHRLTGPEALTPLDQLRRLSEVLGRPLRHERISLDRARELMVQQLPGPLADALLDSSRNLVAGLKARLYGSVEEVTGRPAACFRQWAERHVAAF
jgi:uncharacterized protein YbjT (DUF2867 family)